MRQVSFFDWDLAVVLAVSDTEAVLVRVWLQVRLGVLVPVCRGVWLAVPVDVEVPEAVGEGKGVRSRMASPSEKG